MTTPADILRCSRVGVLLAGERVFPLAFVLDPAGRPVAPLEREAIEARDHVLFVPEESDDALQLLVHLEELGADPPAADRWRAYHGTPRATRWAAMTVESGRLGSRVVDGSALSLRNPLAAAEPALCRRANAGADRLRAAVARVVRLDVPDALCVGVDDHGLDVRARFGIVRVPFPRVAMDAAAAASMLDALSGDR